jgi:Tfp pilus assembly protein PilO
MSRNFDLLNFKDASGPALWLRIGLLGLAALNIVAIYFYFAPPGGSRRELTAKDAVMRRESQVRLIAANRLKLVSQKVQLGAEQTNGFAQQYFLPSRTAFAVLVGELLHMSSTAGLQEGQRTYSQDPIEGSEDLNLLTINANYSGNYGSLMTFLNEIDRSDQLLILDTLAATPLQQGTAILNINMRFLAIVKDEGARAAAQSVSGGRP